MARRAWRRALERFVAGAASDAGELAAPMSAQAVERAIIVTVLLDALASPDTAIRRRTAMRVARMAEVAPLVATRLEVMALTDADEDVRAACRDALRAHRLRVPGEP
ncbi:MAG: hypothetical protein QOJ63_2835 [Solirubrobacteraceae bacterium]|jgi:hypothetical protein|nr:hypothetical protein [Solirubrobacteraceae bacterium]